MHEVVPVSQGLDGWQATPSAQERPSGMAASGIGASAETSAAAESRRDGASRIPPAPSGLVPGAWSAFWVVRSPEPSGNDVPSIGCGPSVRSGPFNDSIRSDAPASDTGAADTGASAAGGAGPSMASAAASTGSPLSAAKRASRPPSPASTQWRSAVHTYPGRHGCFSSGAQMFQSRFRPHPSPNVAGRRSASTLNRTKLQSSISRVLGCGLKKLRGNQKRGRRAPRLKSGTIPRRCQVVKCHRTRHARSLPLRGQMGRSPGKRAQRLFESRLR